MFRSLDEWKVEGKWKNEKRGKGNGEMVTSSPRLFGIFWGQLFGYFNK